MKKIKIGIVGATGLVGRTIIKILEEENFKNVDLKLFASYKSRGKKLLFNDKEYIVDTLKIGCFNNLDYVLFASNSNVSKLYALEAIRSNCVVIDNSSYFRDDNDKQLIVPEINMDIKKIKRPCIIANPNCSTIQCVIAINKLKKFNIKKIIYNTYQSVSGSGNKGIIDLLRCRNNKKPLFYEYDISYTCIPQIGEMLLNQYTEEELKMINETKKILSLDDVQIMATCVRVPVMFGHGVSIYIEFENEISIDDVIKELKTQQGLYVLENEIPTSIHATKTDDVFVGRIKKDINNSRAISMYCCADNVRRGAALNAIYILKNLVYNNI